jgi:RND family efflux transporter MFP subunit
MSHARSRGRFWIELIIAASFLAAIFAWSEGVFEEKVAEDVEFGAGGGRWTGLSVEARAETVPIVDEVAGVVRPAHEAVIAARVAGEVERVAVREGDRVRRGDVLVVISAPELSAHAAAAAGASRGAEAGFAQAERDLERMETLFKSGAVSRREWEAASTALDAARADRDQARGSSGAAAAVSSHARLRAAFDGIVVARFVDPGAFAAPGSPLLRIEDDRALQLEVAVPARISKSLREGDSVHVLLDAIGHETSAAVVEIVPAADPASHTVLIKIGLPAALGLTTGGFGRVRILSGERRVILVPASAVREAAGMHSVRVIDGDGRPATRPVRIGRAHPDGRTEILSGLAGGEMLAIAP